MDTGAECQSKEQCYHCGEPVPAEGNYRTVIGGHSRPMCCPGCKAVAEAIIAAGLQRYYDLRTANGKRPIGGVPEELAQVAVFDNQTVQASFTANVEDGLREATLILEGMTCAACVWLNERQLREVPGIHAAEVNYASQRARVRWDPAQAKLSDILRAVAAVGYRAYPYDPKASEALFERERAAQIRRLGVGGLFGMQVMMIAVGMYFGAGEDMDDGMRNFLRWVSMLLTLPVLLYAGRPFFVGAFRDLRLLRLGMDVPVSLGLLVATFGSVFATVTNGHEVYFDSVVMFVFFLSLARFAEFSVRRQSAASAEARLKQIPLVATRRRAGENGGILDEQVPVAELAPGDRVLVRSGETVPADGNLLSAACEVDEAMLTGESVAVAKRQGDVLIGGGVNLTQPLEMRVSAVGSKSVLSAIADLAERAKSQKPRLAKLADHAAAWFVLGILIVASATASYWWWMDSERWLPITVSVLVVTCPCALSLATPAAVAIAVQRLAADGLLVVRAGALEALAKVGFVAFDKTGTLTTGNPELLAVEVFANEAADTCLTKAAALEANSEHPLARALVKAAARVSGKLVTASAINVEAFAGGGIRGTVDGSVVVIGNAQFISEHCGAHSAEMEISEANNANTQVWLAADGRVLARFDFRDSARIEALPVLGALKSLGLEVGIISGDRHSAAQPLAESLGLASENVYAQLLPAQKLAKVKAWQEAGRRVLVVGDGINDAPVLAGAEVSIAMGEGNPLARTSADLVALGGLAAVPAALVTAQRMLSIIRQNLLWAVAYNLLALPAAAAGLLSPWMAALGMSASSLLVVANAMRLNRRVQSV